MDQVISSGYEGLPHLELSEMSQGVIGPLKNGIQSFNNVSKILLRVNANIVLPGCQTFDDIRQEIKNMKQQMDKSEHIAKEHLRRLDEDAEFLIVQQSHLDERRKQKQYDLYHLKIQLESHRLCVKTYTKALETERIYLKSAEDIRDSMRQRRDKAKTLRNAGICVIFIPIFGLIPGIVMVAVGETEKNQTSQAINSAMKEVVSFETQVQSYSGKVSEYESLICQAERDIQEADNKIHETRAKLQAVSVKTKLVADLQVKMRSAVRQVGQLCGVSTVVELQTRRMILLEPVMKVMEEMITALGQITGDELLYTEGIKSLMWDMKENQKNLQVLTLTLTHTTKSFADGFFQWCCSRKVYFLSSLLAIGFVLIPLHFF